MSTSITPRRTLVRVLILSLGLAASACAETADADGGTSSSTPATTSETPEPDYTAAELEALAGTEEVQSRLMPFAAAPAPNRSVYVPMSDGTRLAVSLYFPEGLDPDAGTAPSVFAETWYTREREAMATPIDLYRRAGFVVAIVDPRGFGASFGAQAGYLTEAQRSDQRELIAWLASQPWSSGDVGTIGVSVSAMLAEASLASGAAGLRAGIVRATEFDQYNENLFPGGVPNAAMHGLIAEVLSMMRAEPCLANHALCPEYHLGPVDGDDQLQLLLQALREHRDNVAPDALAGVEYADDRVGSDDFDGVSPRGHVAQLAEHAVPARISGSWLDGATAQGALARFAALPDVPMQLSLGATTHLGGLDADPFSRSAFAAARTAPEQDFGADVRFVQDVLSGAPIERKVDYYVLGAGVWKSSRVWPPEGVTDLELAVSASGLRANAGAEGERTYQVDPDASSGAGMNRWSSQSNHPIYYGDRRFAAGARVSFDGEPMQRDMELAGAPELCLALRSDQPDGAVFAYLEDVAPDGRVTYLTEGVLRLVHRKTRGAACDPARGTERSFARADALPVVAGERMQIEIPFLPVAARIAKGHQLRLSLAGADHGTFPMLTEVPATWSIGYGGAHGTTLTLPLRPWSAE